MIELLVISMAVRAVQAPPAAVDRAEIDRAVRAAIALPDPKDRRAAALEIAKQKGLAPGDLDAVFAAIRPEATDAPGEHTARFPLWADGKVEDVEVSWYVPQAFVATQPAPLLLAFHGTGGAGNQMLPMWREVADALGMLVVAPSEAGSNEGYAFSRRERDAAMSCLRWARLRFDVDGARTFFTGVSRGGHLTWDLALRRPDVAAAIAPMIGSPRFNLTHDQNNLRFLGNVVKLPIRDLQGSQDDPGVLENLHRAFARLEALHATDAKLIEFEDLGHSFRFESVDWKAFLGGARRALVPESIVLEAANPAEARCAWIEIARMGKEVSLNPRFDVKASKWNGLDKKGQRDLLDEMVREQTAHLEAVREGTGRLRLTSTGVAAVRLHLSGEMVDLAKIVAIEWNGKRWERKPAASCKEMLLEFVERLERTGLSRATVELP